MSMNPFDGRDIRSVAAHQPIAASARGRYRGTAFLNTLHMPMRLPSGRTLKSAVRFTHWVRCNLWFPKQENDRYLKAKLT